MGNGFLVTIGLFSHTFPLVAQVESIDLYNVSRIYEVQII
jgi:hypothetical protein